MWSSQSAIALCITLSPFLTFTSACTGCTPKHVNITFEASLIPKVLSPLPAFSLGTPVAFTPDLLSHITKGISPDAVISNTTTDGRGKIIRIGQRTVGFIDQETGATTFFPNYESLSPINGHLSLENFTHIDNPDLFPVDDTVKHIIPGPTLLQRQHKLNGIREPEAQPRLQYFTAQRLIPFQRTNFTIRGPGSLAIVGVGANAALHSINYLWHPAKQHSLIKPLPVQSIYSSILTELELVARLGPINVTSVEVTYYDSANRFIQPVFTFSASRTTGKTDNNTGESLLIQGYIPLGGIGLERLPSLRNPGKLIPPSTPSQNPKPPSLLRSLIPHSFGLNKRLPTVTVGRYVIRDSESGFLSSAQQFGDTLARYSGSSANFIFSQYYWAYNWLYTTYRSQFANAVNILLTEAHGNWHRFRTSPGNDRVYINNNPSLDIPSDGYGGGSGGSLAYWIIHSCEVIPTETDYPGQPFHSFDYWWSIFNGLHAVMGFRTESYIEDGVTVPFAKAISQGVGVVPAWMNAALAAGVYNHGDTYKDDNRGLVEPIGRPSSISVCGHTDDVVWDIENLGRPGCLWEWWYEN
jgi:hypothetical protein